MSRNTTITLRDFFKLLDSFWIACSIPIPYWILLKCHTSLVPITNSVAIHKNVSGYSNYLSVDKTSLASVSVSGFRVKWCHKAHPTTFSAPKGFKKLRYQFLFTHSGDSIFIEELENLSSGQKEMPTLICKYLIFNARSIKSITLHSTTTQDLYVISWSNSDEVLEAPTKYKVSLCIAMLEYWKGITDA